MQTTDPKSDVARPRHSVGRLVRRCRLKDGTTVKAPAGRKLRAGEVVAIGDFAWTKFKSENRAEWQPLQRGLAGFTANCFFAVIRPADQVLPSFSTMKAKIEIEWECSYEATLRINGREMKVEMRPGITSLEGIKEPQISNTLGGQIASALFGKIGDIMQAHAIAEEDLSPGGDQDVMWKRMSNHLAGAVEHRIS